MCAGEGRYAFTQLRPGLKCLMVMVLLLYPSVLTAYLQPFYCVHFRLYSSLNFWGTYYGTFGTSNSELFVKAHNVINPPKPARGF